MLEFLGETTKLCDRISRRAMLRLGGLMPLGLALPQLLAADTARGAAERGPLFGKAKRCLMLFMWGGPAHQDLWDMKPDAPANIRGEFRPRATNVPGINICELLPNIAGQMDKIALVRSVTHTDNNHSTGAHWMLTGNKHRLSAENFGPSPTDFPHIGSVLTKLLPGDPRLPTFVALPNRIATSIGAVVPGQDGGLLGKQYDPFVIDRRPEEKEFRVDALAMPEGMDTVRIAARQNLLAAMNEAHRELDRSRQVAAMNAYYQKAADLITSPKAKEAFDLAAEGERLRDRYGSGTFGQSLLLARRLLESGVRLVTVYWHREKPGVDNSWDTHAQNFTGLKERLIPQIDKPIATLLADLADRGMLDDTLVVWNSEFGRTPKINGNAGRDHWGPCNTIWFAGGGIPGGQVLGSSDKHAAYPESDPVSPADVTATIFHLLGVDPHTIVHDREERPHTISQGRPLEVILTGAARPSDPPPPEPPTVPPAKPNPAILADRPLGYWLLADSEGTAAIDEVERTESSARGRTPGEYLATSRGSDYRMRVELGGWSADRYTVELCFWNERPFEASAVTGYLYGRQGADVGGDRDRGEHLGIGGTYSGDKIGRLFVFNGDDSPRGSVAGTTRLERQRWYHVVLTRDGDEVTVYLNGKTDAPELKGTLKSFATTNWLHAACRHDGMFPLAGQVRDVAVFDGVLPAERIREHFAHSVASA